MSSTTVSNLLKAQFDLRIYKESIPRIKKVLTILNCDEIWYAPNDNANSIGSLILHLCGNVTQWIGSGIGDRKDDRERDEEFAPKQNYSDIKLREKLDNLKNITDLALQGLTDELLLKPQKIQGFDETNLSILVHVIEHFSYHTGQIAMIAKYLKDQDLEFYEGLDLNIIT